MNSLNVFVCRSVVIVVALVQASVVRCLIVEESTTFLVR